MSISETNESERRNGNLLEKRKALIIREKELDESLENLRNIHAELVTDNTNQDQVGVEDGSDNDDIVSFYSSDSTFDIDSNEGNGMENVSLLLCFICSYLISVIKVERPRKRENVIRCKQYRVKKKNEMMETERNLEDLSKHNEKLKEREMALDSSLEFLHKTYFELIKKNCDCEKEANDIK